MDAKPCFSSGPPDAKVAFVSRSPGRYDVRGGKPFSGPSGQVLDHLLNRYGVTRSEILTTNVVLCQTDDPPLSAIKACKPRLDAEIANAELLILGGAEATKLLTRYNSVHRARGFPIKRGTQRVIVTNNPAAVIKDNDKYPDMVADFRRAFDPLPPPIFPEVTIVTDPAYARSILEKWQDTTFEYLASDLEWHDNRIQCAGFSQSGRKALVFAAEAFEERSNWDRLKRFYERSDIRFIWHNGKADTTVLRRNNIEGRVDEDTFLISYALDERPGYHALEYLLSSQFGWPDYEPENVKHFKKKGEFKPPVNRSKRELYTYNGWDTAGTMQLFNLMHPKLAEDNVSELYYDRLLPAAERMRTVEMNGFNFDVEEACNINERDAMPLMWDLAGQLQEVSGRYLLNPKSTQQMQAIYYQQFGLVHGLRDSGKKKLKHSTGKEVREEIAGGRFACKPQFKQQLVQFSAIHQRYSKVKTVRSNFIEALAKRVEQDGKLYCNFNVGGTGTGRLSSSDPNFQNIIREAIETIPGIRTLFLPSPGNVILSADYSQAELRTCAKLSGEQNLLSIYRDSNRSLHKERAAAFYGDNYTKEEYVKAKNINFGVTYLQSAESFAQMYHMPVEEARNYVRSWWTEFPQLKVWTGDTWNRARKDGYLQSPFGHKRRIHLITSENIGDLRREMVNFKPQNIAAWLTILSIIEMVDEGMRVVVSVHDSIGIDCPEDELMDTARRVKEIMESQAPKQLGWMPDDIPFLVDLSVGPTWGNLEEITV